MSGFIGKLFPRIPSPSAPLTPQEPKPAEKPVPNPVPPVTPSPSGKRITGIDIYHGDKVDFSKLDREKVKFLFAKATQGAHHIDSSFAANRIHCHELGIPFGAYHFLDDSATGLAQAVNFCNVVKEIKPGELWPTLDWESGSKVTDQTQIKNFLNYVKGNLGTDCFLYMGESFCREQHLPNEFRKYPLWIAHYGVKEPKVPAPWNAWTFFQYAEDEYTTGMGKGDANLFNGSEEELKQYIKQ